MPASTSVDPSAADATEAWYLGPALPGAATFISCHSEALARCISLYADRHQDIGPCAGPSTRSGSVAGRCYAKIRSRSTLLDLVAAVAPLEDTLHLEANPPEDAPGVELQ